MNDEEILARLSRSASGEIVGTLTAGAVLGDWRLTAFIARGGNADVYCAEHVALGTSAAVKVLRDEGRADRRARFRREAKILSELKSPSFPRFYAYGSADGRDYLVEELLEPRELPRGNRAAIRFLDALCEAVGELHAKGIVHCDIKPANILFRPGSDVPVLVDLGLAVSPSEDSQGGSRGYSAPEQFLGGAITPAADIHALGVLAERLRLSYRGVIRRATSSIPSERYKTVADFTRAIRRRRRGIRFGLCLLVLGATYLLALSANWIEDRAIGEIHLNGQKIVRTEPLRLRRGQTVRVIGPGTLDAVISGGSGSLLWMTNCMVLNRAKKIYPEDPLRYELTGNVYLNFCNSDRPAGDEGLCESNISSSGRKANNEVRYRGPETYADLMLQRNQEGYLKSLSDRAKKR